MESAEALTDRMVSRELYAKGVANRITRLLMNLEVGLRDQLAITLSRLTIKDQSRLLEGTYTTQRLSKLIEQIQAFSVEWTRIVQAQLESGAIDLIEAEVQFERSFLAKYAMESGVAVNVDAVINPRQIFTAAKRRPMTTKIMREVFPEMTRSVKRRVTESLRTSYLAGETIPQATKRISSDSELGINRRGAEGLARTGLQHYSYNATLDALTAMGIDQVRWVSTLDSRTTDVCMSLDGRVFKTGDPRMPRVPRHFRCRSAIVAYIEGGFEGQRASKGPEGGKPVSASLNYEEWLRRQPASFAREILGPTKYKVWKTGVPVTEFTDKYATKAFTAAELKSRYASLFRENAAEAA